ncbi:MAG: hypothetical protein DHS80DRAFT_31785 [Piptocephalis tieghemiana]|nr:MAG: hypothetical protein DHS80DRAFT_31785 [Piptocephalis tieghemiana]
MKSKKLVSEVFQHKRTQSATGTTSTTTFKSAPSNKTTINNNTFPSNQAYTVKKKPPCALPSNLSEIDRLTQQYYMLRGLLESLHLGLLGKEQKRSLDIGTRTDLSHLEMACFHKVYKVVSVDISPKQPFTVMPSNGIFQMVNVLDGLSDFQDESFDFVFQGAMLVYYRDEQWPIQVAMYSGPCRPGGTMERMELDGNLKGFGECGKRLNELTEKMYLAHGISIYNAVRGREYLENERFTEIHEVIKCLDFGKHHGNMGILAVQGFEYFYNSFLVTTWSSPI